MFREMFRDLRASRELAWRLFVRDTAAQYRQSILGHVWAFIPPLVASVPFVFLQSQGIVTIRETTIPYPAYAMIGTILWQVFVDSLNSPLKSVNNSKAMLTRINLPPEAILLSGFGQVIYSFVIRLVLLAGVFLWFEISPPATVVLVPVGIIGLILFGFMVGMLLTPLGLLYSDIQQAIPLVTMVLMFLTPVLYPTPQSGVAGFVAGWNPLTPLITVTRDWLTLGHSNHLAAVAVALTAKVILLLGGWVAYRLALPHIVSRIGNS
jgi:lipopolysaccharide transport system permease protein